MHPYSRFRSLIVLALAWAFAALPAGNAADDALTPPGFPGFGEEQKVTASLITDAAAIRPGQPLLVGVRLEIADGWKVYWKNPAGVGYPVAIEWQLPKGFKSGEIDWPAPVRFQLEGAVNFGYSKAVILPVELIAPADLAVGTPVELRAKVSWLACKDLCIPGEAEVALTLPVAAADANPASRSDALAKARAALPRKLESWNATATTDPASLTLTITGPRVKELAAGEVYFYPEEPGLFEAKPTQQVTLAGDALVLSLNRAKPGDGEQPVDLSKLKQVTGVLTASTPFDAAGRTAILLEAPVTTQSSAAATTGETGLLFALLLAFVGGIILNLMPCVFPVLSLKILGFVQQAGSQRSIIRNHGFLFGIGVVVSFWALAGLLLALRAGSAEIGGGDGWGFQMQKPGFVLAMILLMFTIGLNLAGVFEIGIGLTAVAGNLEGKPSGGYAKSFFSGVLATLIATPCTAPFMGAALGWALSQPAASAMLVFTALGVGMATPYVVLSCLPQLLRFLPRPGAWMESFKQFMAFPMFATVAWLAWVYVTLTSPEQVMRLLLGLTLFAMGAWWYGRWSVPRRKAAVRWVARVGAAACVVLAVLLAMEPAESQVKWEPFSEQRLAELRKEGRPILIDFTASWCVTCQVNKRSSLRTDAAEQLYMKHNVALMVADWSRRDSRTLNILQKYGRAGVPLYLVFPDNPGAEPTVLPNFLTPGIVEEAIEHASSNKVAAGM